MRTVRWVSLEHGGIEHLAMTKTDDGFVAESVVVGSLDARAFGLAYRVRCDAAGCVRHAVLRTMGGASLELVADGRGAWRSGDGQPLAALDGCLDIDISATPFTNTLPIRRLALARGERMAIDAIYVLAPDLSVSRARQAYTCIEPARRYRYEGVDSGFVASISVDDDGLVVDYEGLFARAAASVG